MWRNPLFISYRVTLMFPFMRHVLVEPNTLLGTAGCIEMLMPVLSRREMNIKKSFYLEDRQ